MKVLLAGDFAPSGRVSTLIREKRFAEVFPKDICDVIKSADFSFVNFESPITEEGFKSISKCGPNLSCTKEAAEAVKYAGFTGVTMANNHILDFGAEGLSKSVECCRSQGLDVVGVGNNLKKAEEVLYLEKDGKRLAVINCCEHEFSIATDTEAGANPLNPIRQFYSIQEAKKNADYVLVIVHGGHEHYQLPSPRMQETYRFFIDAGADAVVNHHQHCYSGYEYHNGKPIFYGLGNFCFDYEGDNANSWYEGYMVQLCFDDTEITHTIYPYIQCQNEATVALIEDKTNIDKDLEHLNTIIADPASLRKITEAYYKDSVETFKTLYQPYNNRILNKLYRIHLLPSFISKKKWFVILNYINCEAHRDKQITALKTIIE